jgi:hypothetical protein
VKCQKHMRSNALSAFDRIRAECVCEVGFAFERTGYVRMHACRSVCVCVR